MTELEVVESGEQDTEIDAEAEAEAARKKGLHVRLRYDADSVHASVFDGDDYVIGTGYFFVKSAGGWDKARELALQETAKKVEIMREFGKPPANETVTMDELPELEKEDDESGD